MRVFEQKVPSFQFHLAMLASTQHLVLFTGTEVEELFIYTISVWISINKSIVGRTGVEKIFDVGSICSWSVFEDILYFSKAIRKPGFKELLLPQR